MTKKTPRIVDDLTRREFLIGAGLLALAPGCANGGEGSEESGANASASARTIEHKYGSTEISGTPERVVTVGYSDHDAVLALGVVPVGVRDFIGGRVVWPWNEEGFGGADPEVLPVAELNFERISALEPDLILGVYSGLTEDEYGTLSGISPTVAQPGEYPDFSAPWPEMTRIVGRSLGLEERAGKLVEEAEAGIAEVRESHPEFEGSTLVLAAPGTGGEYFFFGREDSRVRLLTSLGFETPEEVSELVGGLPSASVSGERLDLADADILLWQMETEDEREAIEQNPLYEGLRVSGEGRDIFLIGENPVRTALGLATVLSIPYLLEKLVPMLAAAVDGDPEKKVEEAAG